MTTAKEILEMIETVDPGDSAKLDEIDARVDCDLRLSRHYLIKEWDGVVEPRRICGAIVAACIHSDGKIGPWAKPLKYTRSRDALKAIRPEDWFVTAEWFQEEYEAVAYRVYGHSKRIVSVPLPTEELAELHAIIQAIAYEREQQERV